MEDIRTPVRAWILAKLYEEEKAVGRKYLLKRLCQASFDSMTSDNDFSRAMDDLSEAKYIHYIGAENGYAITEAGIIAVRKQIITPIEKIFLHFDKFSPSTIRKFQYIFSTIRSESDLASGTIKMLIANAPTILEFIKEMMSQLTALGISI